MSKILPAGLEFRAYTHDSATYEDALELRHRLLRGPLGLVFTNKELALDAEALHFAAFVQGVLVGTLSFNHQKQGLFKMRQFAVDPNFQGKGIGRELVRFAENQLLEMGIREVEGTMRLHAVPLFESLGYGVEGDEFLEVTIPHRRMRKRFFPAAAAEVELEA